MRVDLIPVFTPMNLTLETQCDVNNFKAIILKAYRNIPCLDPLNSFIKELLNQLNVKR